MICFVLIVGLCSIGPVMAVSGITIDGNLDDWGLNQLQAGDWSKEQTWVPRTGVAYIIEDNHNPKHGGTYTKGVHITGNSKTFTFYDEPLAMHKGGYYVSEPYGGEYYDVEALYFTQDTENIYVAIVTSVDPNAPSSAHDEWPGDLALHVKDAAGSEYGYEWGIQLSEVGYHKQGDIVYLPNWEGRGYTVPPRPDTMLKGTLPGGQIYTGAAEVKYTDAWLQHPDHGFTNYVVEVRIPKSVVGVKGSIGLGNLFYADNCLNEQLYVPEFPTIAASLAVLAGVAFVVINLKKKD